MDDRGQRFVFCPFPSRAWSASQDPREACFAEASQLVSFAILRVDDRWPMLTAMRARRGPSPYEGASLRQSFHTKTSQNVDVCVTWRPVFNLSMRRGG